MDKLEIFALIFAGTIIAVRLYMKYVRKKNGAPGTESGSQSESSFPSSSKDDDYEPYAKR